MELIHRALADVAVAAVGLGLAWSILCAVRPAIDPRVLDRYGILVVGLIAVGAAAGAAQAFGGARPGEDLHLLYGALAVGLLPLARSFVPRTSRFPRWLTVAAYVVLGGVLLRLFMTG